MPVTLAPETLSALFPLERSDAFFEALYGDADEGAYTIALVSESVTETALRLSFELRRRPGKCLTCSVTYGLPDVFARHPIINVRGIAAELARLAGWKPEEADWKLGATQAVSDDLYRIPLEIGRRGARP